MKFNENLKYYMESRGIQTKELSAKTGIKIDTINSYLKTNGSLPNIENAFKLAQTLDITMEELTEGSIVPKKHAPIEIKIPKELEEIQDIANMLTKFSQKDIAIIYNLVTSLHQKYIK
ncbi:MAG: helix-turn-helix transcriptional regulator [Treponema sp.]|nr:helix-turn-helix transcriptional regulator [Treponema sp.]